MVINYDGLGVLPFALFSFQVGYSHSKGLIVVSEADWNPGLRATKLVTAHCVVN